VKILIVAANFIKTGGMDRANYALASQLADRGIETHLVGYAASDHLVRRANVIFHRVAKVLDSYFLSEFLLDRVGRKWARMIAASGGRVVVNGGNCLWPDVNWVHYVHAAYRPQTENRPIPKVKSRVSHAVFRVRERRALQHAKFVIANSERTRRDIVASLSVPENRVRTIYCGIDGAFFSPATAEERRAARSDLGWPPGRYVAAFVGGLGDKRKGFDTIFGAWSELLADPSWDVDLVVLGSGADLRLWSARVAHSNLKSHVRLLGFRTDVPRIVRACDTLVAPARYEPYGLAVQEALCCGLPAFVSRSSGIAERFPSALEQLLIPDPDNVEDLARRLRAWRVDIEKYHHWVQPFGEELRAYSWDDMAVDICKQIGIAA
jgi:glycosyltransferase involved in cell wall biosynthesis